MIKENSGKIFRFKLDFNLGFGFAEVYDFSDLAPVDGIIVFVYNRIDDTLKKSYNQEEITSTGICLGPITLYSYPNSRGIGAWKFLYKLDDFLIEDRPVAKYAQDLAPWIHDWNTLSKWHRVGGDLKNKQVNVPYSDVRSLETRILNSHIGVVKKATMKKIIDDEGSILEFYDLKDNGNQNMYLQLINTYYSLEETLNLIKIIPAD